MANEKYAVDNKPPDIPNGYEYLYIKCILCGDRAIIGKNRGAYWDTKYPVKFLYEFLLFHNNCPINSIILEWEE